MMEWSHAGAMVTINQLAPWFACLDEVIMSAGGGKTRLHYCFVCCDVKADIFMVHQSLQMRAGALARRHRDACQDPSRL
jgi:hypothetical protein